MILRQSSRLARILTDPVVPDQPLGIQEGEHDPGAARYGGQVQFVAGERPAEQGGVQDDKRPRVARAHTPQVPQKVWSTRSSGAGGAV
jgi:hypothetical protein